MNPFLAIDWGTTNRRAYQIESGVGAETVRDGIGVRAMTQRDYGAKLAASRERLGDLPVLMAGTVGSTIGWREAPPTALKLLPAEASTPGVLRAMRAVLPKDMPVLPVGGITPESCAPWLAAGAAGFGLGSALYGPGVDAVEVGQRARAFVSALAAS